MTKNESNDILHAIDKRLSITEALAAERHKENKKDLNELFKRINDLPCDKRIGIYDTMKLQQRLLGGLMVVIIGMIIYHLTGYKI